MTRGRWLLLGYAGLLIASHLTVWLRGSPQLPPPGALAVSPLPGEVAPDSTLPPPRQECIATPGFRAEGEPDRSRAYRLCFWRFSPPAIKAEEETQRPRPTVIALHGSPGQAADQGRVARALQERFQVLAPDMPGFADSSRDVPDYGVRAYARYILHLIESERLDQVYLFAHSLGGGTALELSRIAPERLHGIVLYGSIGIQEGEGSGDYFIEQAKYRLGYALLLTLPELVPHFGYLGERSLRRAFIRNFIDTDQRPLRAALRNLKSPLLIVHGAHDPLVPAWAAREHHDIVRHSELVLLDRSHFMVFDPVGARRLASYTSDFIDRNETRLAAGRAAGVAPPPQRRTYIEASIPVPTEPPIDLGLAPSASAWAKLSAIVLGTFVSEDLTCISVGLLARDNRLDLFTGLLGCFVGIFLGDLGLFLLGGFLRQFSRIPFVERTVAKRFSGDRLERLRARFEREGWKLVFLSRFLPGTRFPVYVGAGLLGGTSRRLILVALLAGLIWTPLIVVLTFALGKTATAPLVYLFGDGWLALGAGALLLFFFLRLLGKGTTRRGRQQLRASIDRFRRPEFWSPRVLYAPLVPLCTYFHLRYRGFGTLCAANPMVEPCGGFFGESKSEILSKLPAEYILPYFVIEPGEIEVRLERFRTELARVGWGLPVVLKPDTGEVGIGMRIVRDEERARAYLLDFPETLIAQRYHPGPYELGVFYVRIPGEEKGFVFSITDKVFQTIRGDGRRTLADLIRDHPRYRHQAAVFEARHRERWEEILPAGEELVLARAGNHYQGTLFRDGEHWRTPELEAKIEEISQRIDGFYFGRYDLRFRDPAALRAGREIAIVELNLSSAESTNMYDPDRGILFLYRTLFRQWSLLFKVGDANRRLNGVSVPGTIGLIRAMLGYVKQRKKFVVAD